MAQEELIPPELQPEIDRLRATLVRQPTKKESQSRIPEVAGFTLGGAVGATMGDAYADIGAMQNPAKPPSRALSIVTGGVAGAVAGLALVYATKRAIQPANEV